MLLTRVTVEPHVETLKRKEKIRLKLKKKNWKYYLFLATFLKQLDTYVIPQQTPKPIRI